MKINFRMATVALAAVLASGTALAQKVAEVAISVSAYPSTSTSLPYIVGMKRGVFEKEGIKVVRISGSGGGGQTVRNVLSGEMAFGDVAVPAAASAFAKGEKFSIVGGGTRAISDIYYVTKKGSPIKSIADLKGKSVGYTSPGSTSQAALELSLKKAGVDPKDVKSRAMGGVNENVSALMAGGLDAAVMLDPAYSQNPDAYQVVFRAGDYYPRFQQTAIISREAYIKENPQIVKRFLAAYEAAVVYIQRNPDDAAKAWADETGLDFAVTRKIVTEYAKSVPWSVQFDAPALQGVQDAMRLSGQIKPGEKFPWTQLVTQDYLPAGMQKLDLSFLDK